MKLDRRCPLRDNNLLENYLDCVLYLHYENYTLR